jgi:hypothetical protein
MWKSGLRLRIAQFPEKEYINVILVAVYLWLLKVGGQGHFSSQMVKGDMASGHCISTQGKIDPGEAEQTADPQSDIYSFQRKTLIF